MNSISGEINLVKCSACSKITPVFVFVGENDTETDRWGATSSLHGDEILISRATSAEWEAASAGDWQQYESAISSELARGDLRVVPIVRYEEPSNEGKGKNFQDFLKSYRPPTAVYKCPQCGAESATVVGVQTIDEFEKGGGVFTILAR